MPVLPFFQVDVFADSPHSGNPVAVVLEADELTADQMARFARWTNLSETTFVLAPENPAADYRLRIFTPGGELPFAGHPTLGSCEAWLAHGRLTHGGRAHGGLTYGGQAHDRLTHEKGRNPVNLQTEIVQECAAGLVRIRRSEGRLAFAAPPLRRFGPVDAETLQRVAGSLCIQPGDIKAHSWVDNGPGWLAVMLDSAASVTALAPDFAAMTGLHVGVVGRYPDAGELTVEVRAFVPDLGVPEDPVTGSLNAGLAQWLIGEGLLPTSYIAGQGRSLGRDGRIHVDQVGDDIWIGGDTVVAITGTVAF